jgi:hypothetical protein
VWLIVLLPAAGLAQVELQRKESQPLVSNKVYITLVAVDEYYLDGEIKALGLSELVETLLHRSSATARSLDFHLTPAGITQEGVDRFVETMREIGLLDERSTLATSNTLLRYALRPTLSRPPEDFDWRQIPGIDSNLPADQIVVAVRVMGVGRFRVNNGPELTEESLRQSLLALSDGKRLLRIYLVPECPSETAFRPIANATLTLLDQIHKWGVFEGLEHSGYHIVGDDTIRLNPRSRI